MGEMDLSEMTSSMQTVSSHDSLQMYTSHSEIIDQIKMETEGEHLRPDLNVIRKAPTNVIHAIERGWGEDPLKRPSVHKMHEWIKKGNKKT